MKKGMIVILVILLICAITGIALAAKSAPMPTIPEGPIADLQEQITHLQTDSAALQAHVTSLNSQLESCR